MRKKDLIFPVVATIVVFITIFFANRINDKKTFSKTVSPPQERAVYFWRTTFSLNDYEFDFLRKNKIQRIYVRFFDVDVNRNPKFNDKCAPLASVDLYPYTLDSVRNFNIEIIPVIFITPEAIKSYSSFVDLLAHRLYAMCFKNNIHIKEVQFDCDWTTSTRDSYFKFLTDIRQSLNQYFDEPLMISTTIRLHQLMQASPEVDYGVLMCYNTGDFRNYDTKNSILDVNDVKLYLNHYLKCYRLPLVLALPTYSWFVEYDDNKGFVRLNKSKCTIYDTTKFRCLKANHYEIIDPLPESNTKYVRYEEVSAETILEVKYLMNKHRGKMPVVLFHLDSEQLTKYSDNEIEAFIN